jgi:hypothetical protein
VVLGAALASAGVLVFVFSQGNKPEGFPLWLLRNETTRSIYLDTNLSRSQRLRPSERSVMEAPFPEQSQDGPGSYVFKAYQFVPGVGDVNGYDNSGLVVPGRRGTLVYCETFSWEEVHAMGRVIAIVENISQGARLDDRPCPATLSTE